MNLPKEFVSYTRDLMGEKLFSTLEKGLKQDPVTSIRINPYKLKERRFQIANLDESVAWCKHGMYLKSRPNFTFDPLLHAGVYYVQEASSMFLEHVLRQILDETPILMLDLCAAPGGKTTVARSILPEGSLLFANEPIRTRSNILAENIQKFGHPDVIVTNNYPKDYKKTDLLFDIIVADVPCSGEGMFRKDQGAIEEWSQKNVENCRNLQREIIQDIWNNLKKDGILIYSTCTFNAKEDEENVDWIVNELGAEYISVDIDNNWPITPSLINEHPVYRFIPGKTKGEGIFMAVLRKTSGKERKEKEKVSKNKDTKNKIKIDTSCIKQPENYELCTDHDQVVAIRKKWLSTYKKATTNLKVIHAGINLGTIKGKKIIPSQSLALSLELNRSYYPTVSLTYDEAISYLRKEPVSLPDGTPTGIILLTYQDVPLGFEKNIGNRANNLYPQEWKIKSSHTPDGDNNIIHFE